MNPFTTIAIGAAIGIVTAVVAIEQLIDGLFTSDDKEPEPEHPPPKPQARSVPNAQADAYELYTLLAHFAVPRNPIRLKNLSEALDNPIPSTTALQGLWYRIQPFLIYSISAFESGNRSFLVVRTSEGFTWLSRYGRRKVLGYRFGSQTRPVVLKYRHQFRDLIDPEMIDHYTREYSVV